MTQSIYISDQGELLLIDAPEKPIREKAALASAIAKGVKFKDQEQAKRIVSESNKGTLAHYAVASGQTFPLPTGYKVSFAQQRKHDDADEWIDCDPVDVTRHGSYAYRKLAILSKLEEEKTGVPKSRNRPAPPVVAPSEEVKLERKKIELGEIFEVDGKCYAFSCPRTAIERPTTNHGHILHEIDFIR